MARNVYGGYCRECGRWTPPGFGHFGEGKPTCAECIKMYECCCDYGICEVEFDDAFREKFDGADAEPGDVAYWALPWIADHMRDMQEEACAMFCG